jgi:hypothetical protein
LISSREIAVRVMAGGAVLAGLVASAEVVMVEYRLSSPSGAKSSVPSPTSGAKSSISPSGSEELVELNQEDSVLVDVELPNVEVGVDESDEFEDEVEVTVVELLDVEVPVVVLAEEVSTGRYADVGRSGATRKDGDIHPLSAVDSGRYKLVPSAVVMLIGVAVTLELGVGEVAGVGDTGSPSC